MKKLLFVLLVLGLAVPVSADVLVYSSKQAGTNVSTEDGFTWEQTKATETAYIIVEPFNDGTAGIWAVNLWKEKDKFGKTTKFVEADEVGDVDLIEATVGKKTMWIISSVDPNNRTMLSGAAKLTKIDTDTVLVAGSLTGISIWDEPGDAGSRDLGSGKVTLKFNKVFTVFAKENGITNGGNAMTQLVEFLVDEEGYVLANP